MQRAVNFCDEGIKGFIDCSATGRQGLLSVAIVFEALEVDFVSTSAEQTRREHLSRISNHVSCKVRRIVGGNSELSRRRF